MVLTDGINWLWEMFYWIWLMLNMAVVKDGWSTNDSGAKLAPATGFLKILIYIVLLEFFAQRAAVKAKYNSSFALVTPGVM